MVFSWSSSLESSRSPDRSSRSLTIDARRVFASNKNTCYLPSRRPFFSHLIHPRHLVPGWLEVDAILEVKADWWFHTLEGRFNGFPLNGIFGDGIVFVVETYQGEEEIPLQDARRGFAMLSGLHVFLSTSIFFLDVSPFIPFRE